MYRQGNVQCALASLLACLPSPKCDVNAEDPLIWNSNLENLGVNADSSKFMYSYSNFHALRGMILAICESLEMSI